jgi:hypothetical protein
MSNPVSRESKNDKLVATAIQDMVIDRACQLLFMDGVTDTQRQIAARGLADKFSAIRDAGSVKEEDVRRVQDRIAALVKKARGKKESWGDSVAEPRPCSHPTFRNER